MGNLFNAPFPSGKSVVAKTRENVKRFFFVNDFNELHLVFIGRKKEFYRGIIWIKCKGLKLLEKNWEDYAVLGDLTYKIGICVFFGKRQETILMHLLEKNEMERGK